MIRKWFNTNGAKAAGMLAVNDDFTLSVSNGEVKGEDYDEALTDEKIFGPLYFGEERKEKEESMKMGHLSLCEPVVNIQYYMGARPFLAKALEMPMKTLDSLIYFSRFLVTEAGESGFHELQLITEKEYAKEKESHGLMVLTGARAIQYLLDKKQVSDRSYMVLNYLPVIPTCMRYIYLDGENSKCKKERYVQSNINVLYKKVMIRNDRLRRLKEMQAPQIILLNETRMLQECVDHLINNGARGRIYNSYYNIPMESLEELYQYITQTSLPKHEIPDVKISEESVSKAVNEFWDFLKESGIEEEFLPQDDPNAQYDELERNVKALFCVFANAYIEKNYNRYLQFADRIFEKVEVVVPDREDCEKEKITETIAGIQKGIAGQIDFYIRKQIKWISFD